MFQNYTLFSTQLFFKNVKINVKQGMQYFIRLTLIFKELLNGWIF